MKRYWWEIQWPEWWSRGVIRFLEATELLEPMERLVRWLNKQLTRRKGA